MHLYDCRLDEFIPHATSGEIADILRNRFQARLDYSPSDSEVRSWEKSLGAFADAITGCGMEESWIVLEYQLPLASKRIDCMIIGTNHKNSGNAVLLEFKQWDRCIPTDIPEVVRLGDTDYLHPSAQVRAYREYLRDTHPSFENNVVGLSSCAYLHNVSVAELSGFYTSTYSDLLLDSPAFNLSTMDAMCSFVNKQTSDGAPAELVESILRAQYRPSKQLLDHVANAIERHEPWQLLDEQRVIFNRIMADIERAKTTGQKQVIIVTGGPGTGKSVIAVQVLGFAARRRYNVAHATGSKAFTTNLRGIVRRNAPFLYTHNFRDSRKGELDLIVCDEAHRLRQQTQFGPQIYSRRPQGEEITDAAKVAVFLLDRYQSVRANEVGTVDTLALYAEQQGIPVSIYDLNIQFRCAGSESYIDWVNAVLGLSRTPSLAWRENTEYDVRIFSDVAKMEEALQRRQEEGNRARMVAGFCWDWSDPLPNGELVPDVQIGAWKRPWNAKSPEMWKKRGVTPAPEQHPYTIWATQPAGFGEIGCIYSAQGFEFDYVGVIFGPDLRWDKYKQRWVPDWSKSKDRAGRMGLTKDKMKAVEKLAHTYRVLATRGMKGTYFYFLDDDTRDYFESMLERK
jgi:uncharacterized protein